MPAVFKRNKIHLVLCQMVPNTTSCEHKNFILCFHKADFLGMLRFTNRDHGKQNRPISREQSGRSTGRSQWFTDCIFLFQMLTLTVICISYDIGFNFVCLILLLMLQLRNIVDQCCSFCRIQLPTVDFCRSSYTF